MTEIGKLEWLILEWPELLQKEEDAFQECCRLDNESLSKTGEKANAVRDWWQIVNAVLWMFVSTRAQYDYELAPFPSITLGRLANISEEISNGNVVALVEDARMGGRKMFRIERHHIAYGVAYIEAVRRGDIEDNSPNKTVRQAFNVTSRAVQGWMNRRDTICVGVSFKHLTPQQLQDKMLECGSVYARIGRGAPSDN